MFPFSFSPDFIAGVQSAVSVLLVYFSIFSLAIAIWTFRDSRRRSRNWLVHFFAVVLVLTLNLPGLLLYLLIRPAETLAQTYDRHLEEASILQELDNQLACPRCKKTIQADYHFCPHCAIQLRKACRQCNAALSALWKACPFCGTTTASPAAPPVAAPVAAISPLAEAPTGALPEAAS